MRAWLTEAFVKHISSRDNPFFKDLLKLAGSTRQRKKSAQTLLDGVHLLQAYLHAGGEPLHLLLTATALQDSEIMALLEKTLDVPLTLLDDSLFAELSELKTPSGIIALISQPQPKSAATHGRFCLLLENIQDPGNLGSMLRSAAAAGCDTVYLSTGCADAWSPRVLRAGMGGHFVLEMHEAADLLALVQAFSGRVYAAALQSRMSLYDSDLRGNIAFVIGNEGAGVSAELLDASQSVNIPMPGKVESLNAAAAAAVCLFEAVRQRR